MTITDFLKNNVPFLAGLTPDQAGSLAVQSEQATYHNGQTVLFAGTTVDGLSVLLEGAVTVWVKPGHGKPAAQVAQLSPGDVFGETSVVEMSTAGATIKAAADGTLVCTIPSDAFRGVLAANADFKARTMAVIASRKKPAPPPRA